MNVFLYFAIVVSVIALFWLAFTSPMRATYVLVFLAPWQGLSADFGLRISLYQIALLPLAALVVLRLATDGRRYVAPTPTVLTFAAFAIFSVVWTVSQIPFLPDVVVSGGAARAPAARAILQIAIFLFAAAPLVVVPTVFGKAQDVATLGKTYILSLLLLAAIGWIQILTWYITGTNPVPMGLLDSVVGGAGEDALGNPSYEFEGLRVNRMSSFGGEPKNLGQAFVLGLFVLQAALFNPKQKQVRTLLLVWFILALSTFATFSTTAYYLWLLGSSLQIGIISLLKRTDSVKERSNFRPAKLAIGAVILMVTVIGIAQLFGIPILELIEDRTSSRVSASQFGYLEDFDSAIIAFLAQNPEAAILGLGLGNAHLYADPFLAPEIAEFTGGGVFVAKAQYLRIVSEVGIVGLLLFLFWVWQVFTRLKAAERISMLSSNNGELLSVAVACTLSYMAAGAAAPQFYLLMGAALAVIKIARQSD